MLVNNKGYVAEYWMFNTIIDCGEISNKQDINITISQREHEMMNEYEPYQTLSDKEHKKLNKYLMNDNHTNFNGNEYNKFNSNNRKCKNTKHPKSERYNRNKIESNRMYTKKEPYQYINLQKTTNTNCNKREMQYMPKNSRIYEYGGTQREVMLDSFTKPTLDKNYNPNFL
jgi:hypothetical protein